MVRLDGTITSNEKEKAGRKTKYILTRPEFVFFVDEVGCNTSQKVMATTVAKSFLYKMINVLCSARPLPTAILRCSVLPMQKEIRYAVLLFWLVLKLMQNE
jgi:hypothetical protein